MDSTQPPLSHVRTLEASHRTLCLSAPRIRVAGKASVHPTLRRAVIGILILGAMALAVTVVALRLSGIAAQVLATLLALSRLRPEALSMAVTLCAISMLINGAVWSNLIMHLGYKLGPLAGLAAFLSAGLCGYIVNAAGPAVGCAVSLRRYGVCPGRAVLLTLLGGALGFCAVLLWALVDVLLLDRSVLEHSLPLIGRHGSAAAAFVLVGLVLIMVVALPALAAAPGARNRLARRLLGEHPQVAGGSNLVVASLKLRHLIALVPFSAAAWLSGTLALYVVLGALHGGAVANLGDVVGSAALAATLGSLAFFVPDGMGVRDGALVALLAHSTGVPAAPRAAAAVAMRLLGPLTKLVLLLSALGIARLQVAGQATRLQVGVGTSVRRLSWWTLRCAAISLPE